jgi:hypothetical protein
MKSIGVWDKNRKGKIASATWKLGTLITNAYHWINRIICVNTTKENFNMAKAETGQLEVEAFASLIRRTSAIC